MKRVRVPYIHGIVGPSVVGGRRSQRQFPAVALLNRLQAIQPRHHSRKLGAPGGLVVFGRFREVQRQVVRRRCRDQLRQTGPEPAEARGCQARRTGPEPARIGGQSTFMLGCTGLALGPIGLRVCFPRNAMNRDAAPPAHIAFAPMAA